MSEGNVSAENFTEIKLNEGVLWGYQTQRSLTYFNIGRHCLENSFTDALVTIKRAAAQINFAEGHLSKLQYKAIFFA